MDNKIVYSHNASCALDMNCLIVIYFYGCLSEKKYWSSEKTLVYKGNEMQSAKETFLLSPYVQNNYKNEDFSIREKN